MLEHLVVDLGWLELAAQVTRDRCEGRLVDLREPAVRDHGIGEARALLPLDLLAEAEQIVKEPPGLAGELLDLSGADELPEGIDPIETAEAVARRYERLWEELTREELIRPDERHRINERLERLHELGFDTDGLELVGEGGAFRLRVSPRVVEPGYNQRRLVSLTGLEVQENQRTRSCASASSRCSRRFGTPLPRNSARLADESHDVARDAAHDLDDPL